MSTPQDPIERELLAAQRAYVDQTKKLRRRRQDAVEVALDGGWNPNRIARLWQVPVGTVQTIQKSILKRKSEGQ